MFNQTGQKVTGAQINIGENATEEEFFGDAFNQTWQIVDGVQVNNFVETDRDFDKELEEQKEKLKKKCKELAKSKSNE